MISVIILNYNTFKLTCDCLRSVLKFTTGVDIEIILVDNGSRECDAELFKKEFPNIALIKSSENIGFAKGNNLGISHAKGTIILLLNSDTVLISNAIAQCYEKLLSLPQDFAALSAKLAYSDGRVQHQCARFPGIMREVAEMTRMHKLLPERKRAALYLGSYFNHQTDCCPDWFWGTFFMFRKSALVDLPGGKLNDDYFMYCEDMRWCYDFRKAGKKVFYFSGAVIIHLLSGSAAPGSNNSALIVQNELQFVLHTRGKFYLFVYGILRAFNILAAFSNKGNFAHFKNYFRGAFRLFLAGN